MSDEFPAELLPHVSTHDGNDEVDQWHGGGATIRSRIETGIRRRMEVEADPATAENRHDDGRVEVTLPLLQALAELSPKQREAWVDVHILGRTLQRIGDGMGCTRENVRQADHQATKKLLRLAPAEVRGAVAKRKRLEGALLLGEAWA